MSRTVKGTVPAVAPSVSPSHRDRFADEPILFGDDLEVTPVIFPIGWGEKLDFARKVFKVSRKTIDRRARKFRCFEQPEPNAVIYVFLPAISAINMHDWPAYQAMQEGRFDDDRVKVHIHRVQQRIDEMRQNDLLKAQRVKPKKSAPPTPSQGQLRLVSG